MPTTFKRPAQRAIDRARSRDDSREPLTTTAGEDEEDFPKSATKQQKLNDDAMKPPSRTLVDVQPKFVEDEMKMIPKAHVIKESPVNNREVIRDVLQRGKLPLVLDLDSTLLHSVEKTKFLFPNPGESNTSEEEMKIIIQAQKKIESRLESSPDKFFYVNDQYFTKIRPKRGGF